MEADRLYDRDIREPLFDFLEETYGKIRIIEEKTMGRSRADVVMVYPDGLAGIEIKSDADTYARLSGQVKDYDRFFDTNIVVVGTSHALHIREHVPEYWGVITVELVDGKPDFYMLRMPGANPNMKWRDKLRLLWRPELAQLQEWNSMPKYREKSKAFVIGRIAQCVPERISGEVLKRQISEILYERDYTAIEETLRAYRRKEQRRRR